MEKEDRAYCAGLYEGEGTIRGIVRVSKTGTRNRNLCLRIVMTDLHPLDMFGDLVGFGKVYGPYDNGPGRKPYYEYSVTGFERVQYIICQMWFWLSPRRKEQISQAFKDYKSLTMQQNSVSKWRGRTL